MSGQNTFDFKKLLASVSRPTVPFYYQRAGFQCNAPPLLLNTLLRSFWQDVSAAVQHADTKTIHGEKETITQIWCAIENSPCFVAKVENEPEQRLFF